jgi:V-type H+-transporting ATPase subunit H
MQIPLSSLKDYFTWLCTLAKKPNTSTQDLAIQYFAGAVHTSRNRLCFWDASLPCSAKIVDILKTKKDLQLQYHTLLVVWLVTFEKKIARELNRRHDIIPILVEISKTAIKEKINRLVIGIFRVNTLLQMGF